MLEPMDDGEVLDRSVPNVLSKNPFSVGVNRHYVRYKGRWVFEVVVFTSRGDRTEGGMDLRVPKVL